MKERNACLDIMRAYLCIAVFLYHLGLIGGGYLAVCGFFVLSGYLTCTKLLETEELSLKEYYRSRAARLWIPLAVTVFVTGAVLALIPDALWVSLRAESRSVLLGYNNFWQIGANLDYFARHTDSPFMHLWYISILMQFELLFPLLFLLLKKAEKKTGKDLKLPVFLVLSVFGACAFVISDASASPMTTYYSTFSRIFSLLFGVTTAQAVKMTASGSGKSLLSRKKAGRIFTSLILLSFVMFLSVSPGSSFYRYAMILFSLMSCFMINVSLSAGSADGFLSKASVKIGSVSYEFYLVQYPVIFAAEHLMIREKAPALFLLCVTAASVLTALILRTALDAPRSGKKAAMALSVFIAVLTLGGAFRYLSTPDMTKELKELRMQLEENREEMLLSQRDYEERLKEEEAEWDMIMLSLDKDEADLTDTVMTMSTTAVGDSVMLGASKYISETFSSCYVDAAISRTVWVVPPILSDLSGKGLLGKNVILSLGSNGSSSAEKCREVMEICSGSEVFWIGVTNDADVHVNDFYREMARSLPNAHYIDWPAISSGHPEWFVDGIHLTAEGKSAYASVLADEILRTYREKFEAHRAELIKEREDAENGRITFFGDDLVLSLYRDIPQDGTGYIIYDASPGLSPSELLEKEISEGRVHGTVILAFGSKNGPDEEETEKLAALLRDRRSVWVKLPFGKTAPEDMPVIELSAEHPEYYMPDREHLTEEGARALREEIGKITGGEDL